MIEDVKRNGLKVLPPDINKSERGFSYVSDTEIIYGLDAIKSLKSKAVDAIMETRPYSSLQEFVIKTEGYSVDKTSLKALALSGAFDSFEETIKHGRMFTANMLVDIKSTLDDDAEQQLLEFDNRRKLEYEELYLGIYLTGHPLEGITPPLDFQQIEEEEETFSTLAVINSVKQITTKKGDPMAFVSLSMLGKEVESVCFPNSWQKSLQLRKGSPYIPYSKILKEGMLARVKVKCENSENGVSYFLDTVSLPLKHNKHFEDYMLEVEQEYGIPVEKEEEIVMPSFTLEELDMF